MLRDVSQDSADEFPPRHCDRYSSDEFLHATCNPEDDAIFIELVGDRYAGNLVMGVSSLRRLRMARRAQSVASAPLVAPTLPSRGPSGPHCSQHRIAITDSTRATACSSECQDAMISDETDDGVSEPNEKSSVGDRRPRQPSGKCDGRVHRATLKFIHPRRKPSQERSHRRQQPSQDPTQSKEHAESTMACTAAPEFELAVHGNMQPLQKRATRNMSSAAVRDPELVGHGAASEARDK